MGLLIGSFALSLVAQLLPAIAAGSVTTDWVTVGNPGNGDDPETGYGGVDYKYRIAKYEVTNAQYAEFLNAIAKTDTYSYYDSEMAEWGITQQGAAGSYVYLVNEGWANKPVNLVSSFEVRGFCNWLHNGQPTGNQDATTTEDGAYTIGPSGSFFRNPSAKVWFPTGDEWHKAAYHKNDGLTSNYWRYATGSDTLPSPQLVSPDPGNNANYHIPGSSDPYTLGPPFYLTDVGEFENSESAYGTYDQNGNLFEWSNTLWGQFNQFVLFQGGSYNQAIGKSLGQRYPNTKSTLIGFRLAAPFVLGDYNSNGSVDAADYVIWRHTLGSTTNLTADGNGNGTVDAADYDIWRSNFGSLVPGAGASLSAVPEPSCLSLGTLAVSVAIAASFRCSEARNTLLRI